MNNTYIYVTLKYVPPNDRIALNSLTDDKRNEYLSSPAQNKDIGKLYVTLKNFYPYYNDDNVAKSISETKSISELSLSDPNDKNYTIKNGIYEYNPPIKDVNNTFIYKTDIYISPGDRKLLNNLSDEERINYLKNPSITDKIGEIYVYLKTNRV
jgi:hypothetical protein